MQEMKQSRILSLFLSYKPCVTLTPPLKWPGGKRWLVPKLKQIWRPYSNCRLVDPFVGGMAIALGLLPKEILLNDNNKHLINFYQWLKRGLKATTPYLNEKEVYYKYRNRFNKLIAENEWNSKESAELFYYLNRTGFNGLCRFNSKGGFNVPFGQHKTINYTSDFTDYAMVLSDWGIACGDFSELDIYPEDFIYADPPYDVEFTTYSPGGFNWQDQVRLAKWLAKHRGPVVASNQATKRILELYKSLGFEVEIIRAPRRISCNGDRTPAQEILATKGV